MPPRTGPAVRRTYPSIDRRPDLDRRTLERDYLARNKPVVFSTDSPAWCEAWSPSALTARFGASPIEVEQARVVYVGERAHSMIPLAELIERALAGDAELRWKGLEFLSRVPAMREDLETSPPPHRAHLPPTAGALRDTLWIAPRATMSSLHHDGDYDNLNLQISGKKLFLLIPPPSHEALHSYGSAESPVNPFVPDLRRFPRFTEAQPIEATLSPGEVLLLPKYWWHCVYACEPSVNLSTHFRWQGELAPWGVLSGAPMAHRTLTVIAAAMKRRGLTRLADTTRRMWCAAHEALVPRVVPQERCELVDP